MPDAVPGPRSLVRELLKNHLVMLRVLALLLSVALTTVGYLVLVALPKLEHYIDMAYHSRNAQIATLEQSSALRGWLATGDDTFLDDYRSYAREGGTSIDLLVAAVAGDDTDGLTDAVIRTAVTRNSWRAWANSVVREDVGEADRELVREELEEGRALFDEYREVNDVSTDLILVQRQAALDASRVALLVGLSLFVVALVATAVAAVRRRRRVVDEVVGPTEDLLTTIAELRDGRLSARSPASGVREIDEIGAALGGLATSLDQANREAEAREARLAALAARFETVVRVGREIAGSLSVRYVASSVTGAASGLLDAPTTLWVRGEDQAFHAVSRSEDPHGAVPPVELRPTDVVAVAAADARPSTLDGSRAYPLVLAGMVVGVLETPVPEVDEDTDQVLQALLSTAAAALESANLHSTAKELADVDALTRLPNRRRFEGDIESEWDRCRRYGRPMSLVMVDLDHFKTLNDEHGHLFGDQVLRGSAEAMATVLRTSDTAYRYGGEEFAVLLRETGLEDAAEVADRLRRAVAEFTIPGQGVMVTASAGVAERLSTMSHHTELLAKADAALYDAKRTGRDRVVSAAGSESGPTPVA